jgi:carbamoyltransferase
MANILGISAYYHDSAAALLSNGRIVAACQEERFTRRKGDADFPREAVRYCLQEANIRPSDLGFVVFYEKPFMKLERLFETYLAVAPAGFESFRRFSSAWAGHRLHLVDRIREELEPFEGRICFTEHHEAHAASAFFPSPFEEAAVLTLDAVGEWATSSIGMGRGNRLTLLQEIPFPHSLGMLYSAFTYYTGFKVNSGEYKLMGLAPYGEPRYVDLILDTIASVRDDGSLWLDLSYFNYCHGLTMTSEKFHRLFGGPPRQPETFLTQKEMDLAASVQAVCEQVVMRAACHAHRVTGAANLVMAGGVALNCVANGRLRREGPFEQIWVQPAAGDAGGALGAALTVWHHLLDQPREVSAFDSQQGSLLGPSFTTMEIGLFLDSIGAQYECAADDDDLAEKVATLLENQKVVGWFQGRMEYGPRALGSRSILGDARAPEMQQKMNLKIKFRESFRPFAPCVLEEFADRVFEMEPRENSPYMLFVAPVREMFRRDLGHEDRRRMQDPDLRIRVSVPRSTIPAVTHVDYSARLQTVDRERHGRLYALMRAFYERTGCPVLVNTSFNIRGEPIVCTPEDAHRCFMATEMDYLVLDRYVLAKQLQPAHLQEDAGTYQARYELD